MAQERVHEADGPSASEPATNTNVADCGGNVPPGAEVQDPTLATKDGLPAVDSEDFDLKAAISEQTAKMLATDPGYAKKPLAKLSAEAAALQKIGDNIGAVAAYNKVFLKVKKGHITHKELYVVYGNRSSVFLKLGMHQEALFDAEKSRALAEEVLKKGAPAAKGYIRCFMLKGKALIGLERYTEAMHVFEQGLIYDPFHPEMKAGEEEAMKKHLKDIVEGKARETLALPQPDAVKHRITYHPHSVALHKVRNEDMMPNQLLSTFHADNDHHIKDTYNFVTVKTDVRKPLEHIEYLQDSYRQSRMKSSIQKAVQAISEEDKDCRVLHLGAGSGLHTLTSLRAGAFHVTAVERWLYLASSCKEALLANGRNDDEVKVVYKRPSDLALLEDVPIVCNLLIADVLEDGLLGCGIIPAVSHALANSLLTHDVRIIPASATVYMQAVEILTPHVCGLDMSAANSYRWNPAYSAGMPYSKSVYRPLSSPTEIWYFDMLNPPTSSDTKSVDVGFTEKGTFNAIMFWYDLDLGSGVHLCTGPEEVDAGLKTLQPAIQYLYGEISVEPGLTLPVTTAHNTIRLTFNVEAAEYVRLQKECPTFPRRHFSMLADTRRNEAYDRAIKRAVERLAKSAGEVHVLDMGAGTGVLSLMAARAGADSVVAAEILPDLCEIARKAAACNGVSGTVSVVNRDIANLQRGHDVRRRGVNLVVADLFDSGVTGYSIEWMLQMARKNVVQPGATVIPAAATLYCVGIEAFTDKIDGMDMSSLDKYRWDPKYQTVDMAKVPHRVLTKPKKVSELAFNDPRKTASRDSLMKLEVIADGTLNAIMFWFDLHLDEEETLTTAPPGFSFGGKPEEDLLAELDTLLADLEATEAGGEPSDHAKNKKDEPAPAPVPDKTACEGLCGGLLDRCHYWGHGLQYFERAVRVSAGGKRVALLVKRDGPRITFSLREDAGEVVPKAPWKCEWGGGSSIENPHVQRVQYCDLLVKDFLQRVKCKRFPSIEKDMKMVLAQCGSLYLDPAATSEVYHYMVLLEKIHQDVAEFSPGLQVEAITEPALELH